MSGDRFEVDNISIVPGAPATPPDNAWVSVVEKPLIAPLGSLRAVDDVTRRLVNTPWVGNVTNNDTGPPGSRWEQITDPFEGTVVFNPDGSFTYTPTLDFVGTDYFDYRVCKPAPDEAQCSIAKVIITYVEVLEPTPVPTLHAGGLLLATLALAGAGWVGLRRQRMR